MATRLTHVFTFYNTLGGVESVLRRHHNNDAQFDLDSQIIALFESSSSQPRVLGLGLTWRDTIYSARRKFRQCRSRLAGHAFVYHNAWGLPFLADLDQAERRLVLLHSDLPTLSQILRSQVGWVDGVMAVTEPLAAAALASHPSFTNDRVAIVPYPIRPCPDSPVHPVLTRRPIRLGFVGRVVREQKRIDRLPVLCRKLDQAGVSFQFEVLGEGPDLPWLQRQFSNRTNVLIHGRQEGDRYWNVLRAWDAVIFFSDYEGLPIALLEALSAGVIPIYPRIGSGGDSYAAAVQPELVYPAGDLDSVVALIKELLTRSAEEVEQMRQRCLKLATPHQGNAYERSFSSFVHALACKPRISASTFPPRGVFWSDHLPFGLLRRMHYRGFFKRTRRPQS